MNLHPELVGVHNFFLKMQAHFCFISFCALSFTDELRFHKSEVSRVSEYTILLRYLWHTICPPGTLPAPFHADISFINFVVCFERCLLIDQKVDFPHSFSVTISRWKDGFPVNMRARILAKRLLCRFPRIFLYP